MPLLAPRRAVIVAGCIFGVLVVGFLGGCGSAAEDDVSAGRRLYIESCASCHGAQGEGSRFGPSLEDSGAAAADFYLRTGRMPLGDTQSQAVRKPPAFSEAEIDELVAFVASLGDGPPIPEVDEDLGSLADGQALYVGNCAPCHGATGAGGAAGPDAVAPSLYKATPVEIAEAVVVGPGQMPVFDFDAKERASIIRFLIYLREHDDPGGADIGGLGPVPEGFVAWGVGVTEIGRAHV